MRTMVPVLTSPRAMKVTASPVRNFALAASRALRASSLSGAQDFGVAPSRLAISFQGGSVPRFRPGERVGDLVQDGVGDLTGRFVQGVHTTDKDQLLLRTAFAQFFRAPLKRSAHSPSP